MAKQTGLSGWGRTFVPGHEIRSENLPAVTRHVPLSRGLGRSYGDASLPPAGTLEVAGSRLADRILGFDEQTGVLRAEAGLVLSDMNRLFLGRGFFTPVTPGTRFVTLGGMVASDVHGKNHHVDGTIGRHVQRILLQVANGRIVECSRDREPELFFATLGGMGLTGHILEVQLQLQRIPSPWIYRESYRLDDLDTLLARLKEAGKEWPFTVAWIDTVATGKALGRGILYCGRWAEPSEAPSHPPKAQQQKLSMPFALPSGLLNRMTIGLFNQLVYHAHYKAHKQDICDPDTFFYPLDSVRHWNLAYGQRGVTQHQSVIPEEAGAAGVRRLIEVLAETGSCSFLSVIKDCGEQGEGILSFPRPGMSLALDIPIQSNTQEVIDRLNQHVLACGGRIYLTKDGFTRKEDFRAMEPRLPRFCEVKRKWDPEGKLHSALADRLLGTAHAEEDDADEERIERASQAFHRAEVERQLQERAQKADEQPLAAPKIAPKATLVGVAPVSLDAAPAEPSSSEPAASEVAIPEPAAASLPGIGPVAPMPPEPVAAMPAESGAIIEDAPQDVQDALSDVSSEEPGQQPFARHETTLVGPAPTSSPAPAGASSAPPAPERPKLSVPPPPASTRPSTASLPPPPARLSAPPPPRPAATSVPPPRPSAPAPPAAQGSAEPAVEEKPPTPSTRPAGFGKQTLVGLPPVPAPPVQPAATAAEPATRNEDEKA